MTLRPDAEVLVLRALGLGDLLASLPALRALRAAFPAQRLTLATPAWLAPLALHSGAVDRVVPAEPLGLVAIRRPAVGVNLHGSGPQSHRRLLQTEPETLLAFRHPEVPESAGMPAWRSDEHEVHRWCRLLEERGIPADPCRLELDPTGLAAPPGDCRATIVHPGASSAARRWPAERWAEVARHEADQGRRVLVTAGPGELSLAARVADAAGLGPAAIRAGAGLMRLAGLVAGADRVVCGDTGVAHLATALGRPSVVLFGPVSPEQWGPPPDPRHRALWSGRRGDPHGGEPDRGLLEIEPGQVIEALAGLPG